MQKFRGRGPRPSEQVNMVGHDDVGLEIVMTQLLGRTVNPFDHQAGDLFALEPEGPGAGGVQVTIDPDEGLPRAQVVRSRKREAGTLPCKCQVRNNARPSGY